MKRLALLLAALGLSACTPQQAIHATFGNAGPVVEDQAHRVAWCESLMTATAVSPGGGNHGLFQLNDVHRDAFVRVTGQAWAKRYDAFWNAVYAKHLWDRLGWQPWTCRSAL